MRYLFLLLFLLPACGKNHDVNFFSGRFAEEASRRGIEVSLPEVRFTQLGPDKLGRCEDSVVLIDQANWDSAGDDYREMTVFHELGHCVLNRNHNDEQVDGRPVSLMATELFYAGTYKEHREEYIEELFKVIAKAEEK